MRPHARLTAKNLIAPNGHFWSHTPSNALSHGLPHPTPDHYPLGHWLEPISAAPAPILAHGSSRQAFTRTFRIASKRRTSALVGPQLGGRARSEQAKHSPPRWTAPHLHLFSPSPLLPTRVNRNGLIHVLRPTRIRKYNALHTVRLGSENTTPYTHTGTERMKRWIPVGR